MTSNEPSFGQRILLLESITASGLPSAAVGASLWREATHMREALARDLRELIGDALIEAVTPQATTTSREVLQVSVHPAWPRWRELLDGCEAVLPVAPESGGELLALTLLARLTRTRCLGSRAAAVRIAGSKRATAYVLARAGIPVVPTRVFSECPRPDSRMGWVVKPDDGAGAVATLRLRHAGSETDAGTDAIAPGTLRPAGAVRVIQPFVDGPVGSLFAFGRGGGVQLLASSTQYVEWIDDEARLVALGANEPLLPWGDARELAVRVAAALPGLDGFWGVDFILGKDGLQVLEVNPRPTSTYPALSRSLGWNPARLLLGLPAPAASTVPGRPIRLGFE